MNEIYQDHECACLARFRSDDELIAHIEEYQSRERYHSLEAERCRTHTRASDDNDQGSSSVEGGEVMPETETVFRKSRNCPHPSCEAKPAFGSRLALRRHFLQHIEVIEVCVGCHELFRLAKLPHSKRQWHALPYTVGYAVDVDLRSPRGFWHYTIILQFYGWDNG
ncbi:hypothetical protein NCS52_00876100 [Fusarium sp. LHS14.1]|nr:hypothetical protein NCS52_00876100 [Fusarium sp. LHS14.1]